MSEFKIIDLPMIADARGHLVVLQEELPFEVRRVFWIGGADGQTRGGHRHRATRQALVAVEGKVDIFMNDGQRQDTVSLDRANRVLLVEPEDWHTMTFGTGSLLLVFSSHLYNRADYVDEPY